MAKANWKVTLEFTSDDGEGAPSVTTISQTGDWKSGGGQRAPNECVANTMSAIMKMLLECECIAGASTFQETCEAFIGN